MKRTLFTVVMMLMVAIAIGQSAIHVEKKGNGSPIILLPGFTTPGSVWNETIGKLDGNYETHAVSYAGFNGLEPIGTPWYDPILQELISYIKKEKLTDITIIGHSMGGNLAVDLAAAFGEKLAGLIIVDSLPCMREVMMPGVPASSLQYDSPYNNQMLNMPEDAFKNVAESMARNMTAKKEKIPLIASWALASDRKTYVYGYTDLLKLDLREKLSEIKTETLVLGATFPSKEIAMQTLETQYTNLKNKTITMPDESKHFIMYDQPDWFYTQVNDYLATYAQ